MVKACVSGSPDCRKASDAINANGAAGGRLDAAAKARLNAVAAGTYYLMGSGVVMAPNPADRRILFWDVKIDVHEGTNAVTLDLNNAKVIHP